VVPSCPTLSVFSNITLAGSSSRWRQSAHKIQGTVYSFILVTPRQSTWSHQTSSCQYSSSPFTPAGLQKKPPRFPWPFPMCALMHAPLWANVLLDVLGKSLERSVEFLRRSKTLQVCLTFDMWGEHWEPPGLKERVAFLSPHEHRLRALHIRGATTPAPTNRFLHYLSPT